MNRAEQQSRSDFHPIWLNMQSHSREATVSQFFFKYAEPQSRNAEQQSQRDCYPIWLNMQSHSREATVMPRRRGEAASKL